MIDPLRDFARLQTSGLPCYELLTVSGTDYQKEKPRLKAFSDRHKYKWLKVHNKFQQGERYSTFPIASFDAISMFIETLDVDLSQFEILLFECQPNKYGGNIIINDLGTRIDIAKGTQDDVGKSKVTPYKAYINHVGRLCFKEEQGKEPEEVPLGIKEATWKTLRHLKMSRAEYEPGYFEFIISDKNRVYFLDYKTKI